MAITNNSARAERASVLRKAEKHAEKDGWPDGRQACNRVKTKNKLRQARRTCSPLQPAARTGEAAARRSWGRPSAYWADPEANRKMDDQPRKDNDEQTRARRPSKRPKKMGKQRRALEKEGTQMTIFPEPHPGRRRAGPPDEEARI